MRGAPLSVKRYKGENTTRCLLVMGLGGLALVHATIVLTSGVSLGIFFRCPAVAPPRPHCAPAPLRRSVLWGCAAGCPRFRMTLLPRHTGAVFTAGKKQGQTGGALFPGVWFCASFESLNTAQNFRATAGAWNPGCARGEPKIHNGKRKSRGIAGSLGRDFSVREFPVCCPGTMPRSLFFSGRPFLCARPSP